MIYVFKFHETKIHYHVNKKKLPEELGAHTLLYSAKEQVEGFDQLMDRFEKKLSILGRGKSTFKEERRETHNIIFRLLSRYLKLYSPDRPMGASGSKFTPLIIIYGVQP